MPNTVILTTFVWFFSFHCFFYLLDITHSIAMDFLSIISPIFFVLLLLFWRIRAIWFTFYLYFRFRFRCWSFEFRLFNLLRGCIGKCIFKNLRWALFFLFEIKIIFFFIASCSCSNGLLFHLVLANISNKSNNSFSLFFSILYL